MDMKKPTETVYLLRGIPVDLWREVKMQAASRRETVRTVLLRALAKYVPKGEVHD